jgi:hypothetical protein
LIAESDCWQGKSIIKYLSKQHLSAIGIVPTRLEPFLFNAFFHSLFLSEQIEGEMPEGAEILSGLAASDPTFIAVNNFLMLLPCDCWGSHCSPHPARAIIAITQLFLYLIEQARLCRSAV